MSLWTKRWREPPSSQPPPGDPTNPKDPGYDPLKDPNAYYEVDHPQGGGGVPFLEQIWDLLFKGGKESAGAWSKLLGGLGGIFGGLGGGGGGGGGGRGGGQSQVQIPEVPAYQQSQPQSDMGPLLMALFSQGQEQQPTAPANQGQQPDLAALIAALTDGRGGYQGGGY